MTFRRRSTHASLLVLALVLVAPLLPMGVAASPGPGASPAGSAVPVTLIPEDTSIAVGVADRTFLGRLPLVLAEARGYLRDAGFTEVEVVEIQEPLPGLLNDSLDLAIIDARQAADAFTLGLPVQAIAGHRVVPVADVPVIASPDPGAPSPSQQPTTASPAPSVSPASSAPPTSPWASLDLVVATTDSVATRPGTLAAFTLAYVRALGDLRARALGVEPYPTPLPAVPSVSLSPAPSALPAPSPSAAASQGPAPSTLGDPILDAAAAAGLELTPDLLGSWPAPLEAYRPFDGGFDDPALGDGLGSLRNRYPDDPTIPDLEAFVATRTLHAAQQALGLVPNPPAGSIVPGSPVPSVSAAP